MRGGGGNSHLIAHEFEHILLDEQLRAAGASRLFVTSAATEGRALGAVEKDLRRLRERRRLPAEELEKIIRDMVQSVTNQLFNMPFDLWIERRLHQDFTLLHDAQFVGLARQMAENAKIAGEATARDLIPQRVLEATLAMNAAFALFVDDLYAPRTAYADAYTASGALPAGRKLYALFRKMTDDKAPGVEYALVDAWAGELRLRDWYLWKADADAPPAPTQAAGDVTPGHRTAQQTTAMREGGPTNPDYLADPMVQMSATMHMLAALQRFSKMAPETVQAVAMEIAVLGMEGINYIAGEQQYTLKSLPGEEFSGLSLLCLEYAGFKLTRPEVDTKIPLDAAYRSARTMFDAGMGG